MIKPLLLAITLLALKEAFAQSLSFPKDFKFGVASASYQVEGGWNASGKGESIWDHLLHQEPNWTADHQNGDVACDSYHLWSRDLQMLKELGVNSYRFSLSWPRILPSGYTNYINPDGVRYYNDLIDALLKNNIEPIVTLYHWDLPQSLQEIGGWSNAMIADYFEDFAKVAFDLFGDRVKTWLTFNDPLTMCTLSYGTGDLAPRQTAPGIGEYICGKNLLIAHAKAYHLYGKQFRRKQKGKLGIVAGTFWFEPKNNSTEDIKAAERVRQFQLGWWMHPIYSKFGDYPKVMKTQIERISKMQNFSTSRLPQLSSSQVKYIRGSYDFFGLNHYSTYLVSNKKVTKNAAVSFETDFSADLDVDPNWKSSATSWLKVVPSGFRKILNWIKKEYGNLPIIITENGYSDVGELNDTDRMDYIKGYLNALLKAIHDDKCNVQGYIHWSLLDNFEWNSGYTVKFGLYYVNFTDPKRTRTAKSSADLYKTIIKTRTIP